jgi:aryl-alcohol dehydrogenase-like predicted oxidoreductase
MQYKTLGNTGMLVSTLCLGTMTFSGGEGFWKNIGTTNQKEADDLIKASIDAGINFFDTADVYSEGQSETMLGQSLKNLNVARKDVVVATKVYGRVGPGRNDVGASRGHIMDGVEASLRRLQTDHIDLYQIHRPDPGTDIEETLSALSDLIRSGKVRAIGSSTMPASDMVEAQWVAERRGLARFRTEQPPYSILNRGIEAEVLPVAQRYGMGTLVWSPLAKGMLTGRIRKGQQTDLRRATIFTSFRDELRLDAVEQIIPLAEQAGLPMTHLAMAFAIAHPDVTSAIIGPRTMEQLDDLLAGVDVTLTDDILDRIDEIVPPGTDVGAPDQAAYLPPAIQRPALRRRPVNERAAA